MSEDLGISFLAECFGLGAHAFIAWCHNLPARRVMYVIKNDTMETLFRTAHIPSHGAWKQDDRWVFPWETISPGETLKCCLELSKGHLDLQVHILCPESGPNEYFDTSLSEWANKECYFKEMTPFRQKIRGIGSRQVTAVFLLGDFLSPNPGPQIQAKPIMMSGSPSAVTLNDKIYYFYGAGGNPMAGFSDKRLLLSVYEQTGFDLGWREGRPLDDPDMVSSPSAVVYQGHVYVFYQGPDATLRYVIFDGQEVPESESTISGTFLSCAPSATVFDDKIWVAFQSRKKNSEMYYVTMDKSGNFTQGVRFWHNWCSESPCLTTADGKLWCATIRVQATTAHSSPANGPTMSSAPSERSNIPTSVALHRLFLSMERPMFSIVLQGTGDASGATRTTCLESPMLSGQEILRFRTRGCKVVPAQYFAVGRSIWFIEETTIGRCGIGRLACNSRREEHIHCYARDPAVAPDST